VFQVQIKGVRARGLGSRTLTLSGTASAVQAALARLTLVLGNVHGKTTVNAIATTAGSHAAARVVIAS
jgi:hypothetical protein